MESKRHSGATAEKHRDHILETIADPEHSSHLRHSVTRSCYLILLFTKRRGYNPTPVTVKQRTIIVNGITLSAERSSFGRPKDRTGRRPQKAANPNA